MISGDGASAEYNWFAQNHFVLKVPSNWLVHTSSGKSDEILILAPICLNLVLMYKILKYQFQILI